MQFLILLFFVSHFLIGIFFEYISAFISVIMTGYLVYLWKNNGKLRFYLNASSVSILLILMLLMDIRAGKKYELKNNIAVIASTVALSLVCVFIGLSCFSQHMNNPEHALKFYPLNTTAKIDLLMQADTPEEMDELADSILKQNKSVSIAYSAKAKVAFSRGDFATLIENKLKAIELARYSIEEYKDFDYMLTIGTDLYRKAGDRESAAYCMELRNNIPDMLESLREKTSPLAYKIDDKPVFELD